MRSDERKLSQLNVNYPVDDRGPGGGGLFSKRTFRRSRDCGGQGRDQVFNYDGDLSATEFLLPFLRGCVNWHKKLFRNYTMDILVLDMWRHSGHKVQALVGLLPSEFRVSRMGPGNPFISGNYLNSSSSSAKL